MFIRIGGKLVYMPFVFEADTGKGGGEGEGDKEGGFKRLLERNQNDAIRVAEKLYDENHGHREAKRKLEQQVADLTGKVPAEGAVVLVGDDAKAWASYKALGAPDALTTALADKDRLAGEVGKMQRDRLFGDVATAAGYDKDVLMQIAPDLKYVVEEVERNGKKAPAAFVLEGERGETKTPIADYMKKHHEKYLPVLQLTPSTPSYGNGRGPKPAGVGSHSREEKDREKRAAEVQRTF